MKKLFMASFALTIFAACIALTQMTSCSKSVAQTHNECVGTINGLWIGTYTVNGHSEMGQQYFSLIIKPNGTFVCDSEGDDSQHLGVGVWTLSSTGALTCQYNCVYGIPQDIGVTQTFDAVYDKSTGTLTSGTWRNTNYGLTNTGTFKVTKTN